MLNVRKISKEAKLLFILGNFCQGLSCFFSAFWGGSGWGEELDGTTSLLENDKNFPTNCLHREYWRERRENILSIYRAALRIAKPMNFSISFTHTLSILERKFFAENLFGGRGCLGDKIEAKCVLVSF